MQLEWRIVPAASTFYTAGLEGEAAPAADPELAAAVAGPAERLRRACQDYDLDYQRLLDHLIFYAGEMLPGPPRHDSLKAVTLAALMKLAGSQSQSWASVFRPLVEAVAAAAAAARPKLADELPLRLGPLAEQWEARGPGLLWQFKRLTEPEMLAEAAKVLPVQPVLGGGGRALPAYNTVVVEAVLANPMAELPEVVRLAWLLAALNFDLPRYREGLAQPDRVLPLATIPPLLAAAAEVELVRDGVAAIGPALEAWRPCECEPELSETLTAWWQTYLESQPPWNLALKALEQMLG